jgi:hypothetical protein
MKNVFLFSIILLPLFSCDSEETAMSGDINGAWLLTEVLSDPGDGSGVFYSVESDKTLSFTKNGTVISNGALCGPSIQSGDASSGSYSMSDSTITADCDPPSTLRFDLTSKNLIVHYPCFEGCAEKYVKVK